MRVRLTSRTGFLLLGIWLVLWGLFNLGFSPQALVLALLAIAAGVLILIER